MIKNKTLFGSVLLVACGPVFSIYGNDSVKHASYLKVHVESVKKEKGSYHIPLFQEWRERCEIAIPHFIDSSRQTINTPYDFSSTATNYFQFMDAVNAFIQLHLKELCNAPAWIDQNTLSESFFNKEHPFTPFVQAIRVPANTQIIIFGDRHGDVRSTLEMINEFAKKGYFEPNSFTLKPQVLLLGLGDYVDRGNAGVETLLTILWLKLQNPKQVFLIRGNHEDCSYNVNKTEFQTELKKKLGEIVTAADLEKIARIYDCLPAAIFLGSGKNFMVGCHGFLEVGYHPKKLLDRVMAEPEHTSLYEKIELLKRCENIKKLSDNAQQIIKQECIECPHFASEVGDDKGISLTDPCHPVRLGWMWSYAIIDNGSKPFIYDTPSGTWQWGKDLTHHVLNQWSTNEYHVSWVFRGHQHSHNHEYPRYPEIMHKLWQHNGLYKLWCKGDQVHSLLLPGAFTVSVAPDNLYASLNQDIYPGFNYDTWVVITTRSQETPWGLEVVNKAMFHLPECSVVVDGQKIIPQLPCPSLQALPAKNEDNFYAVDPGKLYRTKLLFPERLEMYLKKHAIKTIINLREAEPQAYWHYQEVNLCKKLDVKMYDLGFHPTQLPSIAQLNEFFTIIDNPNNYPILIHCFAGADRTGLACALYVAEKLDGSLEQALAQQHLFYGHNQVDFPHLKKCTNWWFDKKNKYYNDRKAILADYNPTDILSLVTMPRLNPFRLKLRV